MQQITFNLNGEQVKVCVEPTLTLLDLLRDQLGLTGTKKGCAEGECGACTIIFEGRPVNSCLIPACKADGKTIITIEGLHQSGEFEALSQAFVEVGAVQCGYCTPGIVISTKAILDKYNNPTDEQIKDELSGHLCRCTGYLQFIEAIHLAVHKLKHA